MKDFNPNQFLWTSIVLLVVNIFVFTLLEKYTTIVKRDMELSEEKMKYQSDADIMGVAAKSMKRRLEFTNQLVQQDRVMRHDRRHFEATILSLLEEGRTDEAIKNLEERLAIEPKNMKVYCENTTVNAALSHYIAKAEGEGITVIASLNIPSHLQINEMELAITISNLLENSIHACEKLPEEDRFIKISAKYKKQLLLEITNSCVEKVQLNNDGYPFTKDKNHGVGTRSVLAFVNKSGSDIQYSAEDNSFRVRMIVSA